MAEPNYDVELKNVESEKTTALSDLENTYAEMTSQSDRFYQDQIDNSEKWKNQQTELQKEQNDFALKQIEEQKEQAKKDYIKEQSGAYADWQKQSNAYGANAEQKASLGMTGTGYSESSQVSMYTAYQNRVATARDAFERAKLNYENKMTEARLQNSSVLAEIAYKAQQEQLELALEGFQYKNQLLLDKVNKKETLESDYYQRYLSVLSLQEQAKQMEPASGTTGEGDEGGLFLDKDDEGGAGIDKEDGIKIPPVHPMGSGFSSELWTPGVTSSGASGNVGSGSTREFKTSDEAIKYMEKQGCAKKKIDGLMPPGKWALQKYAKFNRKGEDFSATDNYDTYEAYLSDYVAWATGNK